MKRWEAWWLHVSTLLVGGTGLVYFWMRYLATPADPYSVLRHPWQPAAQHLHVLAAPLLVFAVGLLWRGHVRRQLREGVRESRPSGLGLAVVLVPMVASGYLLQVSVGEGWRRAWAVLHVATGALWVLGWALHALPPLLARRGAREDAGEIGGGPQADG